MNQDRALSPSIVSYRKRRRTSKVIIHDSHTPPSVECVEQWLVWHGRQNGLLDIGYHYLVDRHGHVHIGRPEDEVGNHTPGWNHESIGVCMLGDKDFPPWQRFAMTALLANLRDRYPGIQIIGHYEVQRFKRRPEHKCPALDMDLIRKAVDDIFANRPNTDAAAAPAQAPDAVGA